MEPLKEQASLTAFDRARICIGENALDKARSYLKQAISYDSTNLEAYKLLGLIAYVQGEFTKAGAYWQKASSDEYLKVLRSKAFIDYVKEYDLCVGYVADRRYAKAASILYCMRDRIPDIKGYRFAGLVFAKIKLKNLAAQMWIDALRIDRNDPLALEYMLSFDRGKVSLCVEKIFMGVILLASRLKLL
jgi:tetratricopeptide (TPR) repeat protein